VRVISAETPMVQGVVSPIMRGRRRSGKGSPNAKGMEELLALTNEGSVSANN